MWARRRKRALIFSKGAVGLAAAHRASTLLGLLGQLLGNPAQSKRIAPKRYAERIFSRFSLPTGLPITILPSSQLILTRNHLRTQIEFNWSAPRRSVRSPSTSICAAWRAFERVPLRRSYSHGSCGPGYPKPGSFGLLLWTSLAVRSRAFRRIVLAQVSARAWFQRCKCVCTMQSTNRSSFGSIKKGYPPRRPARLLLAATACSSAPL